MGEGEDAGGFAGGADAALEVNGLVPVVGQIDS